MSERDELLILKHLAGTDPKHPKSVRQSEFGLFDDPFEKVKENMRRKLLIRMHPHGGNRYFIIAKGKEILANEVED